MSHDLSLEHDRHISVVQQYVCDVCHGLWSCAGSRLSGFGARWAVCTGLGHSDCGCVGGLQVAAWCQTGNGIAQGGACLSAKTPRHVLQCTATSKLAGGKTSVERQPHTTAAVGRIG